ncbi:hypothetical protein FBZ96_11942 [Bradyrhizobium stylosanthis]|uniref:Uncharacterized protein n=1 Tax=Bradyrhizobium stylosanthis TaxID=1803665 RepID=A0A560CXI5_9BRAD|nr:hypothetical protein FBZ96_11942 [Bradyrhizobium stylosanthis]
MEEGTRMKTWLLVGVVAAFYSCAVLAVMGSVIARYYPPVCAPIGGGCSPQ